MAKSSVIDRKDMKEPDKFQEAATQAASWMAARKKQVAAAGAVAVLVLLVVAVIAAVQGVRAESAGKALSGLLRTVAGDISAVAIPGSPNPSFPTQEAKQRAVVAQADAVVAQHGGTRAGALAQLAKGDAHYALREWDAAAQAYDAFLKDAPADDSFRFGALEGLALVAEAKNDLAGAAAAYERMAREAPRFADRADLARARVLAAAGKVADAKALLTGFAEKHKESMLTASASQQLASLGAP
jgi:tetratricopeptide (TPR) repeat protein